MNIFRHRWVDRAFIGIAFFLIYFLTLNYGIFPADNGEFQLVARDLGLAHPPGFGLYTILAHLFSRLPLPYEPIVRVNLLSILLAVATLLLTYETAFLVCKNRWAGAISAMVLGTMTTFWVQATVANIRTMTAFFAVLLVYLAVRVRVETQNLASLRGWFVLSVGLAGTHHLSLAFMGLVLVGFVGWHDRKNWRDWWKLVPWGLIGVLPWGYLLWREPSLRVWDKFWEYALALGFSGDFFAFAGGGLGARMRVMVDVLILQVSPILLVMGLVGALVLFGRNRWLGGLLLGCFGIHTVVSAIYRAPQTVEYMLPAYVVLAIWVGVLLSPDLTGFRNLLGLSLVAILVGFGLRLPSLALDMWAISQGSRNRVSMVADLPENTNIVSNWHWFAPLQYWAEVDGRDDLNVVYLPPQGEDYRLNWRDAVAAQSAATFTTNYYPNQMQGLGTPITLPNGYLWHADPDLSDYQTSGLVIKEMIEVLTYKVTFFDEDTLQINIQWQSEIDQPFSLFTHLVDVDGNLVGQSDVVVAPSEETQVTTFLIDLFATSYVGKLCSFEILMGAYGIQDLDALGNQRLRLAEPALACDAFPPKRDGVSLSEGLIFKGAKGVPAEAKAGDTIEIAITLESTRPVQKNLAISVSMTETDWRWRVQDDSVPALGAIPTLKWMTGTRVRSPHTVMIPADAQVGDEAVVRLTLYDAFTSETVAVLEPEANPDGLGIELGRIRIVAP